MIKMHTHLVLAVEESTELALYDYPCCDPSYGSVCVAPAISVVIMLLPSKIVHDLC